MTADAMNRAPVDSRFGKLPASDAELNGDYLQSLVRLATMTGDRRFLDWARRISDAYIEEVLPGTYGVPADVWDFQRHSGATKLKLRDHGNEMIIGLSLQYGDLRMDAAGRNTALSFQRCSIGSLGRPIRMGCCVITRSTQPRSNADEQRTFRQLEATFTAPVYVLHVHRRKRTATPCPVIGNLPKYRKMELGAVSGSRFRDSARFDGYADSIQRNLSVQSQTRSAGARLDPTETKVMLSMQRADGHVEDWYGEGNFNRTLLLHAYMKSQGVRPEHWKPGMRVGGVREGERLYLSFESPARAVLRFDLARHRRVLNFDKNYVRLNEFPEWYTVDENTLYRVRDAASQERERILLGSELIAGIETAPGEWIVEPLGKAPYAKTTERSKER